MRSVIDFLAEINTSLSLYRLISTDLIRLLQNPLVSLRIGLSSRLSVRGGVCRMPERRYQVDWRGVFLPVSGRGLHPGPCSLGPELGILALVWVLGTPWQSDPACCNCSTFGLGASS